MWHCGCLAVKKIYFFIKFHFFWKVIYKKSRWEIFFSEGFLVSTSESFLIAPRRISCKYPSHTTSLKKCEAKRLCLPSNNIIYMLCCHSRFYDKHHKFSTSPFHAQPFNLITRKYRKSHKKPFMETQANNDEILKY